MNTTRIEPIQFDELVDPGEASGTPLVRRDVDALGHVAVGLEVSVGKASTTIKELFALVEDSVLELDTELDALMDIRIDGKTFARGQLVAVGDHYGIKIVEIA